MAYNPYENEQWSAAAPMRPGGSALTKRLLACAALAPVAQVLDLGCGRGMATAYMAEEGHSVVGVDISHTLIAQAQTAYPHVRFVQGDALKLPFGDGEFNAVLLECVLSAMKADTVLSQCARITNAGGKLLISDVYAMDTEDELSLPWWDAQLKAHGFKRIFFEDSTAALRSFAAQMLWETGRSDCLSGCLNYPMPKKIGYFVLIADKLEVKP